MQTKRLSFTEAELSRRMLLEFFFFFCIHVLLYPNFATELFSYLHEKSLFTENVFEKQGMRVT